MDKIAVVDFGGQYAHLIANRLRRLGVYAEIVDPETSVDDFRKYVGIVLSGGPASVRGEGSIKINAGVLDLEIPILGICYGHQLIAYELGGSVEPGFTQEYGQASIKFHNKGGLFEGIDDEEVVWMSHFDQVTKVPEGFEVVATTTDCPIAAMANYKANIYSVQFHPEVTHTPCGRLILDNFINMTHAKREWTMDGYIEEIVQEIKDKVGDKKVFMMVSGGVDSTVAFTLLDKALGQDRVYGLFVDTGFMRLNEREEVQSALKNMGIENLHVYDASAEFFEALKGIYDPEEKRKIIGDLFIDVQERLVNELGLNPEEWILGQGTIYPDTIETGGTKHAHTIKTHHNRVARIQEMLDKGTVIEPIAQLYKDEVREVGMKMGLEEKMVVRHPFPGPGLAIRALCAEQEEYPSDSPNIDQEINDFVAEHGLKAKVVPVKSVGVQGDERTYRNPVVLYGKDCDWSELELISTRITNSFKQINRVIFALTDNDFSDLSIQKSWLTQERVSTLQKVDKVVMDYLIEADIYREIWQFPTVLMPIQSGSRPGETIVLRPVSSTEAMTASFYQMDHNKLKELVQRIQDVPGVSAVVYDLTNKPPGTIEWE